MPLTIHLYYTGRKGSARQFAREMRRERRNRYLVVLADGDEVVETIMGNPGYEGFGVHVTLENCGKVLKKREKDYYRYKKEYEETGTILLKGYEDSCTIPLEKSHALQ